MTLPFAQRSFPEIYEQELVGPLFRPFAESVIEETAPAPGQRVLDIACGTGIVARLAHQRVGNGGTVVGVDISPLMLAVARSMEPRIDWREGDALALPLRPDEEFDVVICQQGLQFFPDRTAGVREMRRALEPGGRLAISTWRPDDELPFLRELRRIAERHVGPIADRRHSLGEAGDLEAVLLDAGFREIRLTTVSHTVRFQDGTVFVRLNAMAMVGMSAEAKTMGDDERDRLVQAIVRDSAALSSRNTDAHGRLAYLISSNVATATR